MISNLPNREGAVKIDYMGQPAKPKKKMTFGRFLKYLFFSLTSLILVALLAVTLLRYDIFSGFIQDKDAILTIYPKDELTHTPPDFEDIINILLIGSDSKDDDIERGRADSLMILTVDGRNKVVKLTSIMRDSYVYIKGGHRSPDKINAAFAYGGPALMLRTVNDTFRLNIKYYVSVDMNSMASLIDLAGGLTIDLTSAEIRDMNRRLTGDERLSQAGSTYLNGMQAVQYARIRKIDSDSERTRRQRYVLDLLYQKFKGVDINTKRQMIKDGLSLIRTNMSEDDIIWLGLKLLPTLKSEIQQLRLPIDGYYKVNSTGVWYMVVDYNRMIPEVYKFIFGSEFDFDPVPTIPYNPPAPRPSKPTAAPTADPEPTKEPDSDPSSDDISEPDDPYISEDPDLSEDPDVSDPDDSHESDDPDPDASPTPDLPDDTVSDPDDNPEPTVNPDDLNVGG